jgi:hypothetical protein
VTADRVIETKRLCRSLSHDKCPGSRASIQLPLRYCRFADDPEGIIKLLLLWRNVCRRIGIASWREGASKLHPIAVAPIIAWLCSCAGECPQSQAFVVNAKQVGKPLDRPVWI